MKNKICIIICVLLFNMVFAQKEHSVDSICYIKALEIILNDYENEKELLLSDTLFDKALLFSVPSYLKYFFKDTTECNFLYNCFTNLFYLRDICGETSFPTKATFFSNAHQNDTLSAKYILCFYLTYECGDYKLLDAEVFPIKNSPYIKRHRMFWYSTISRFTMSTLYRFWIDTRDNSVIGYKKSNIHHE